MVFNLALTPKQAVELCDRNFGIGGDGVIFALPGTPTTDYTMRIFNSDGSEELPGGCLDIEWSNNNQHLYMTGPAQRVFTGEY